MICWYITIGGLNFKYNCSYNPDGLKVSDAANQWEEEMYFLNFIHVFLHFLACLSLLLSRFRIDYFTFKNYFEAKASLELNWQFLVVWKCSTDNLSHQTWLHFLPWSTSQLCLTCSCRLNGSSLQWNNQIKTFEKLFEDWNFLINTQLIPIMTRPNYSKHRRWGFDAEMSQDCHHRPFQL